MAPHISSEDYRDKVRTEDVDIILQAHRTLSNVSPDDDWLYSREAIQTAAVYKDMRACARRLIADLGLEPVKLDPIKIV